MGSEADNKFTWVIKNFSSLQSEKIFSDAFVICKCKWRLVAYPKANGMANYLYLYLCVADSETLPYGWRRYTKFRLTVVNQLSEKLSQVKETQMWFDGNSPVGLQSSFPLAKVMAKNGGFLVNDLVKIVVEIDVLEVIGKLDEGEDETQPLKKVKREESEVLLLKEALGVTEFQVLPSQVEFVSRVFTKYPDIAIELRAKNESLRTACMYVFLSLIGTMRKSLQELSKDDLVEADNALTYLKHSGFKLEWLEKKLEEVKAKKKEKEIGEIWMQELEKELKDFNQKCKEKKKEEEISKTRKLELEKELKEFQLKCSDIEEEVKELKQKCSDMETQLKKEKAKVLAIRASPLTLDE